MSFVKVTSPAGAACSKALTGRVPTPTVTAKAREQPTVTADASRRCASIGPPFTPFCCPRGDSIVASRPPPGDCSRRAALSRCNRVAPFAPTPRGPLDVTGRRPGGGDRRGRPGATGADLHRRHGPGRHPLRPPERRGRRQVVPGALRRRRCRARPRRRRLARSAVRERPPVDAGRAAGPPSPLPQQPRRHVPRCHRRQRLRHRRRLRSGRQRWPTSTTTAATMSS